MGPKSKDEPADFLKRVKEEIVPLIDNAVLNCDVIFPNPHLLKCWKTMDCKTTECKLHGNGSGDNQDRCWQEAGTYCGGKPQGSFVQKHGDCINCNVFKGSCPTIIEEIGEHFNNMMYLLNKQNKNIVHDKDRIEHLNKELIASLEKLKTKNREFQNMVITDRLTGLFDRHHLLSVLEDEIARCHRYGHSLTLMMIDIDGFKGFNDLYGYKAGDKMLTYAGTLIKKNIRKFDRAFRYSAKEFVVVLPETDLTLAYIVAERIRSAFEKHSFTVKNKDKQSNEKVSRTFSIGISLAFNFTTNNIGIEDLISQTAQSVNEAREKGGNMCVRHE